MKILKWLKLHFAIVVRRPSEIIKAYIAAKTLGKKPLAIKESCGVSRYFWQDDLNAVAYLKARERLPSRLRKYV